jgi:hypothetical protein
MLMTTKTELKPADIRRFNLKKWTESNPIPIKEKSFFSQLIAGTASFGEKAARRLEVEYNMGAGYLDTPTVAEGITKPKDHLQDLLKSDPQKGLEEMLLNCYRGCKGEDRDLLLSIANQLFSRAKPSDKKSAPFGRRKSDKITNLGNVEPEPGEEDAKNRKNRRIQEQGVD